jgi:hypothetical protein
LLPHGAFALLLVVYVWLGLGYAFDTPAWENPDEPAHYNFVADLVRTGQLPVMEQGAWDQPLLERLTATQFNPPERLDTIRYEAWQPPLYYLLAVPAYLLPRTEAGKVRALRVFDVALGGLTVLVTYLAALEVLVRRPFAVSAGIPIRARPWLALAVPGVLVGIPMFTAMSAAINNDALANLFGAVLTAALLWTLSARPTLRIAIALGVLLGLALLTKMTLAAFIVLVPASLVAAALRTHPSARGPSTGEETQPGGSPSVIKEVWAGGSLTASGSLALAAVPLGVALLVMTPWLVRQGLTYGWTDLLAMRRHDAVVVDQPRAPGITADYLLHWSTVSFHSFWAQFGWMGVLVPDRLYWVWGILTLLACAGLLVWLARTIATRAWREPLSKWDFRPALLSLVCLGVLTVDLQHNLEFDQAQGRFVYPALLPLCIFVVVGWATLLPARLRAPVCVLVAAGLIVLNQYTLSHYLATAWAVAALGR